MLVDSTYSKDLVMFPESWAIFEEYGLKYWLNKFGLKRESIVVSHCGDTTRLVVCSEGCSESRGLRVSIRCNMSRLCPVCSDIYLSKLRSSLLPSLIKSPLAKAYNHRGLRHIVLGYKVYPSLVKALKFGLPACHKAISKLCRLKYIKKRVFGGIYSIEFKVRSNGSCYVHVHLLVDSQYLSLRDYRGRSVVKGRRLSSFSKAWFTATDGVAYVPRIVRVYSVGESLSYILKYVSKQPYFSFYQKVLYYRLLYSKRVFGRIGSFFNDNFKPVPLLCPYCDSFLIMGEFLDVYVMETRVCDIRLLPIPPPPEYQIKLSSWCLK